MAHVWQSFARKKRYLCTDVSASSRENETKLREAAASNSTRATKKEESINPRVCLCA